MLNLEMTVRALDLVVGDVCLMQEVAVVVLGQASRVIVAGPATLTRRAGRRRRRVACGRRRSPFRNGQRRHGCELQACRVDDAVGDLVAQRALGRSFARRVALEVAPGAAHHRGAGDVTSLHDLRVAGCTGAACPGAARRDAAGNERVRRRRAPPPAAGGGRGTRGRRRRPPRPRGWSVDPME